MLAFLLTLSPSVVTHCDCDLQTLGMMLRPRDLRSARLACSSWRNSLSTHITARDPTRGDAMLELTVQPELETWRQKVQALSAVYPRAVHELLVYISSRTEPQVCVVCVE